MTADLLMTLLEASLRSLAVSFFVAGLLLALRVRSSSARHAAWTTVVCAMLLMPVLQQWVPGIAVPVSQWRAPTSSTHTAFRDSGPRETNARQLIGSEVPSVQAAAPRSLEADPGPTMATSPAPTLGWSVVFVLAYVLGVLVLLVRLVIGWRAAWRLWGASRPVLLSGGHARGAIRIAESNLVAAPVTLGVLAPVIILPASWRSWPSWNVRAVVAHEWAHVRRRDPLVSFIARLNCCVFWFHPLAWWLQRELAVSAEESSDDRAVLEVGEADRYAKVLLEMASAVRLHGGRLLWQGVGIDGSGLLGQRIDRVLRQDRFREWSRGRKATLVVSCAAAIFLIAACRQQSTVAALREDAKVAERLADQKALQDRYAKAEGMTATEVDQLEAALKINPEDLTALEKLQIFYQRSGQKVFGWNEMIARRRPHVLWLIQHQPEHALAVWRIAPVGDPAGYAEAKKAWLAQTSRRDAPAIVLGNAARFLEDHDPQLAEQMLLRAKELEPNDAKWSPRLGSLYGRVIGGPRSPRDGSPVTAFDSDPYARQVRLRTLESQDAELLATAGYDLAMIYRDPVRREIGRTLLERSLKLNPQSARTRLRLTYAQEQEQKNKISEIIQARAAQLAGPEIARKLSVGERLSDEEGLRLRSLAYEATASAAIAEDDRLLALVDLADTAYMMGEARAFTQKDEAGAKAYFERSKKAAERALELASKFRESSNYGFVVYRATIALATHALREGDKKAAVRLMLDATNVPASERLEADWFVSLEQRLMNYLLKEGERESVARFLEASAKLRTTNRFALVGVATAIREGRMPEAYQYMVTPH